MKELLIGSGNSRIKHLFQKEQKEFQDVTTLDIDSTCNPDVVWDLNVRPLPFDDETFDEIHAYEVLEHLGTQGDYKGFFEEFGEYWRILKPDGLLIGSVPHLPEHLWSDPGHTRFLNTITFGFLSQKAYEREVGVTPMTDYRSIWKKNFEIYHNEVKGGRLFFALRKLDGIDV